MSTGANDPLGLRVTGCDSGQFEPQGHIWIYIVNHYALLHTILRKTIEGYLDSVPSLTLDTIKTKLIMNASHSSRYLQSKGMFDLSHASMIKVQYMSKWCNPRY